MNKYEYIFSSNIGNIRIEVDDDKIYLLTGTDKKISGSCPNGLAKKVEEEVSDYLDGKLEKFSIKTFYDKTPYVNKVVSEIAKIPYGQVITYKDISDKIKSHPRAVGMACGKNPIPLIIPCHRVVGMSGKLTGFSMKGGVEVKKRLLDLEGIKLN
ncbi:MAG: methylated-DNA--[protein]-cysteine S-methyltransferase [Alphaproteobacteria bacterium]|jgi:methylated-DNA-[protein]-cysteine S-methyltransferase|nr:methylated-DNA--[protein]-cysteine S-methyltransferase [Alphaproteobacteria bacterium]